MRKALLAVAVCGCMTVSAEDTHDYSEYVSLLATTNVTVGSPGAGAWSDGCEMSDDKSYIVPSGVELTSHTDKDTIGGTWKGKEFAVQGRLTIKTTGTRANVPVISRLAVLPGGMVAFGSAHSTLRGDTLDIRGTAENPSVLICWYRNVKNASYYPLVDTAVTGEAGSVVHIRYTDDNEEYRFQRAYRVTKGFAGFYGTVVLDGKYTWLRPHDENLSNFDIGGTLWVTNGASLYIASVSPTFGSLVMAKDTTLRLQTGRKVTVNGPFSIAKGAQMILDSGFEEQIAKFRTDYDTGEGFVPKSIEIISVCGAKNAAAVDRDALFSAITANIDVDPLMQGGVPRLKLLETEREDGGKDFKLSHEPFVAQLKNTGAGNGPYGNGDYEGYLSDGNEISPDKDYLTPNYNIYFEDNEENYTYEFPGRSWTIIMGSVRSFGFYGGQNLVVDDLRLIGDVEGDTKVRLMKKNITARLCGNAAIYGTVNFRLHGSGTFNLDSDLTGPGDVLLTLDYLSVTGLQSSCRGRLSLGGDNSSFGGRFLVGWGRKKVWGHEAFTNLTLQATSSASLGGPIETFTFDAVKISDTCTLSVINDATFEAGNRGWCLMNGSTVAVAADKTVTMNGTVTFGGESVKTGEGTLVLGGSARHYDSENDAAADVVEGTSFRVVSGGLGATSAEALSGVALKFADGARIVAFPETAGVTLSKPPKFEGDALDVEIAHDGVAKSGTVNLLTLPSAAGFDASKLSVRGIPTYKTSQVMSKTVGGSTVYYVTFVKPGLVIGVR